MYMGDLSLNIKFTMVYKEYFIKWLPLSISICNTTHPNKISRVSEYLLDT